MAFYSLYRALVMAFVGSNILNSHFILTQMQVLEIPTHFPFIQKSNQYVWVLDCNDLHKCTTHNGSFTQFTGLGNEDIPCIPGILNNAAADVKMILKNDTKMVMKWKDAKQNDRCQAESFQPLAYSNYWLAPYTFLIHNPLSFQNGSKWFLKHYFWTEPVGLSTA